MPGLRFKPRAASLSFVLLFAFLGSTSPSVAGERGGESAAAWELADRRGEGEEVVALYVEKAPTPGRPTFRLETTFDVPPTQARDALIANLVDPSRAPSGQRREILERTESGTVVHTYIELPLMLADRELALRVVTSHDPVTDVHRIEWAEANELLPPADEDVVRLTGTSGYWEFRPDGEGRTKAIHETRTELGGSFPIALGDRLMKGQAIESVESLRTRIDELGASDVAAGPPE